LRASLEFISSRFLSWTIAGPPAPARFFFFFLVLISAPYFIVRRVLGCFLTLHISCSFLFSSFSSLVASGILPLERALVSRQLYLIVELGLIGSVEAFLWLSVFPPLASRMVVVSRALYPLFQACLSSSVFPMSSSPPPFLVFCSDVSRAYPIPTG